MSEAPHDDPSISIPVREAEALLRLIEAAPGVRRRYQFFVWMQTHVHPLLPHVMAVCGAYRRSARELEFEAFHGVVLEDALLARLSGTGSTAMAQVAERWIELGGRPLLLTLEELHQRGDADPAWAALRAVGLGQLMVHGVARPDRPRELESLFLFARPGSGTSPDRGYYLELLMPHLHAVYLRVLAVERGIGQPSARPRSTALPPAAQQWNVTEREREILSWIREGMSNLQIGEQLGISALTVKNHVQKILRKLGAANRAQAVSMAIAARLLRDGQREAADGADHGPNGS